MKGKDVICKDGVSNKFVLRIYKQNMLSHVYRHEPYVYHAF